MKKVLLLSVLLLFTGVARAQSTCFIREGKIVLQPLWLATEVMVQTSTSLQGPWFTVVHVDGKLPCPGLEFTLPKTNERERYWRLLIIR